MSVHGLLTAALACGLALLLLSLNALGQRLFGKGASLVKDLTEGNHARALVQSGHILGVLLITGSVVAGGMAGADALEALPGVVLVGVLALALHALGRYAGLRMLVSARLASEIARGNTAAGLTAAGNSVATALLISRNVAGVDVGDLPVAVVFFVVAQLSLYACCVLFRALTKYDDGEEILGENVAAALSYTGLMVAVALVLGHALDGDFEGWSDSLAGFGLALIPVVVLYPVRQVLLQSIMLRGPLALRGGILDVEIARDRNVGLGALEAMTYVGTALLITHVG